MKEAFFPIMSPIQFGANFEETEIVNLGTDTAVEENQSRGGVWKHSYT